MKRVRKVYRDIKSLKIQSAANIAKHSIKCVASYAARVKAKNPKDFLKKVGAAEKLLVSARPTEPLLRNYLRYLNMLIEKEDCESVAGLKKAYRNASKQVFSIYKKGRERLFKIGAERIPSGSTVFTICHSSTVVEVLKRVKARRKKIRVIVSETRPRFQGRLTAKELVEAGIDTTMIIDSEIIKFLKEANVVLFGADAITSEGVYINKVGSAMLAFLANEFHIPLYVCATTWKFNPETITGEFEKIEQRDPKEVWPNPPRRLKIFNPAFDRVEREHIDGVITEYGVFSPSDIMNLLREKQPWMFL